MKNIAGTSGVQRSVPATPNTVPVNLKTKHTLSTNSLLTLDSVLNGKIIGKTNLFCFSPTMLEFTKIIYLFLVEMGFGSFSLK